ncbi:hypothetical protein F2Q69_00013646 [Brassica cretica]|uniref:Uncharacterized protein n=1 Tax=Brassica cretica TaxID=69181 RepID=A0A8S9QPI1_BRACR|nr:hypothetical protein F2Q69_00013646 [Brassica cretica]
MAQGNSTIIQLSPQANLAIITEFVSNYNPWKKHFFFVHVNNASVEENCIPIFRTRWGWKVINPLPPTPDGLHTPDLPIEEGAESSMDGFVPYEATVERERSRPRKEKHVIVDDDAVVGQSSPTDNILRDYLNSQAGGSGSDQIDLDELLDFDFPSAEGESSEVPEFTKASRMVNGVSEQPGGLHGSIQGRDG